MDGTWEFRNFDPVKDPFVVLSNDVRSRFVMHCEDGVTLAPGEWFAFPRPKVFWFEAPMPCEKG